MPEKFRRTHYITDVSLQLKYVAVTFAVLIAFWAVSLGVIYTSGWAYLVEKMAQVYPQGRLQEIMRLIYWRLGAGFLILLPLAVFLTVFLSHTVAGPLVRIKRYLRLMARGEFDLAPLVLRRYDELKDVAQLINEITAKLGPRMQERRRLIQSLQETVRALRQDVERMPSAGQELHRKVNYLSDTLRILE